MVKKVLMAVSGMVLAGVIVCASPIDAKAALNCTYDIINDANGHIAHSSEGYAKAKANEDYLLSVFNAVKANPAHTQLEYETAYANYVNAANVSKWWLQMINNSNAFLTNIKGREAFEDRFAANRAALADLTKLQAAKTDADGAANIAAGVAAQIADVERAIAGYQVQVAACPSMQSAIDDLTVKLNALKADYSAKVAAANEKAAVYNNYLNTLNYKGYSVGFENYQWNRELKRDTDDWNPKGYY
ncbi:MAG: hypothetical protein IK123_09700 [Lachnospiraceae bacterium]|nr:hypothetical protein [Lachnospiraceae bacterium]